MRYQLHDSFPERWSFGHPFVGVGDDFDPVFDIALSMKSSNVPDRIWHRCFPTAAIRIVEHFDERNRLECFGWKVELKQLSKGSGACVIFGPQYVQTESVPTTHLKHEHDGLEPIAYSPIAWQI